MSEFDYVDGETGEVRDGLVAGFRRGGRRAVALVFDPAREPSLTHQEFRDECDINNIMKRYERDRTLVHLNRYQGDYGDFSEVPSFQEAQHVIQAATEMFMTLPARVRAQFENDPSKFLNFAQDPANVDKMVELGLAVKKEAPPPVEVVVTALPAVEGGEKAKS